MSMGGENTATTSSFKSVEHAVEVTAKRRLFLVASVTPIPTLKVMPGIVWTAARHKAAECQPYTWEKSLLIVGGWLYVLYQQRRKNKKEETKKRKKNEKTDVVQKKGRKQRKARTVTQVIDEGGAQVGTSERPGRCQPSTLRRKSKYVHSRIIPQHVAGTTLSSTRGTRYVR